MAVRQAAKPKARFAFDDDDDIEADDDGRARRISCSGPRDIYGAFDLRRAGDALSCLTFGSRGGGA